jgi:hypothetical protein
MCIGGNDRELGLGCQDKSVAARLFLGSRQPQRRDQQALSAKDESRCSSKKHFAE